MRTPRRVLSLATAAGLTTLLASRQAHATGLPAVVYLSALEQMAAFVAWWMLLVGAGVLARFGPRRAASVRLCLAEATVVLAGFVPPMVAWGLLVYVGPWRRVGETALLGVAILSPVVPIAYGALRVPRVERLRASLGRWRWSSVSAGAFATGALAFGLYLAVYRVARTLVQEIDFNFWFSIRDALLMLFLGGPFVALGAVVAAELSLREPR